MTGHPGTLSFELHDRVARITLRRPDAANGIDPALASELALAAQRCDLDPGVGAVVLSGTGRFFSAGGDVKAMAAAGPGVALAARQMADGLHRAISSFHRMSAPLVVAVNGVCAGAGFSLALAGDIVLAAASARFTMAYTGMGLSPDGSSTHFLPRLVGLRRAQELMLTNRTLSAAEALDWGLVTSVVDDEALDSAATAVAARLSAGSRSALGAAKGLLAATFTNALETQMELEGRAIATAVASADGQEGIRAFLEKRAPRFNAPGGAG